MKPSWDTYFLEIARVVSTRSGDPNTHHGCVLVDFQNRIISTGYNGPIAGINDDEVPQTRPEKYDYMIHAEENAILFARASMEGATAYITGYPCTRCARSLMQAGVSRIVIGSIESACVDEEAKVIVRHMAGMKEVILHETT